MKKERQRIDKGNELVTVALKVLINALNLHKSRFGKMQFHLRFER